MASAMIGNLAVSLTMNTAAFQRGATLAEKRTQAMSGRFAAATASVKGLGAAIGAGFAADALYRVVAGAFEMGSALSEASEQVGVSVEALQELRFAAEQTGVSSEKMDATIKRLNKSLGDLEMGKASAVKAFAAIGLSADDLRGKRPEEALRLIADALNKLPSAAERVAIGQQLMGRGFSDLLPLINGGSAALDKHAEAARANGIVTAEEAAALDDLADRWDRLKTVVGVATAKIIAEVVTSFQNMVVQHAKLGEWMDGVKARFMALPGIAIDAMARMVTGIQEWITGRLSAIWDGAIRRIEQVKAAFFDMWTAVTRRSYVPDMVDDIAAQIGRLDEVMVAPALNAVQTVANAFSKLAGAIKGGGFLNILEAVVGVGTQLGGMGAFGKGIQGRLSGGVGLVGGGGFVKPSANGSTKALVEIADTTGLFQFRVNGQIAEAAPGIMNGGASIAAANTARSKKWALSSA